MKARQLLSLKPLLLAGIAGIAIIASVMTALTVAARSAPAATQDASAEADPLAKILHTMDETAASFRSAEANFVWTTYNSVINDVAEKDTGKIYFRRTGRGTEMAAEVAPPASKQIVFSDGKIQVYMPETRQEDVYDVGAHREEFEAFLVLGFGSSGSEMRKSFDIKYQGTERIGNKDTAKLELTPLSPKVKAQFPRIDLWIDTERGLAVKQQLWETGGDYRVADYSDVQLKQKIADNVFKLKTTGNVRIVSH